MAKRIGVPQAKPGELIARWGRPEPREPADLVYAWNGFPAGSVDCAMLASAFEGTTGLDGKTLRQELEARGYDITTLRFSVQRKSRQDDKTSNSA